MATNGAPVLKNLYGMAESFFSTRTDAIINIAKSEERLAQRAGIAPNKSFLVYNGIENAEWEPVPQGRQTSRLLFVGRYDHQKGIELLVEAMRTLWSRGFQLQTIGGPVIGKPAVVDFPSYVTDLGWKSPEDIREAMASADIIVMPSRWEGFSQVALEAMRAGRAIMATTASSLPEAVVDGETGVLCAPGSAQAIVDGILRLSELDVRQLGINGRKRYEQRFTAERMFRQIDEIYRKVSARGE